MKTLFKFLLIIIVLNSCKEIITSKHSSFYKVESFIKSEKRLKGLNISSINIDKFTISEYKRFKPNSAKLELRKIVAFYDLTLNNERKEYKSKAEVSSIDSINWEIIRLSVINQTDSINKHFEETVTWENPDTLKPYNVTLKITGK